MAGIALQMEGPVAPREWVRVGDKEGEVVQMNWRTITLRSRDGHHVVLPNARVAREDIVNYSRPGPSVMLHATVDVAYAHPPAEVKAVLEAAVSGAQGVSATPPVEVLVSRFAESAVEYDLRFWTRDLARVPAVRDAALSRAWYALRRAGLAIPFPQREVALRHVPENRDEERLERRRVESFDALRNVETFRPLTDEQVRTSPATRGSSATRPARRSCARAKRDARSSSSAPATSASRRSTAAPPASSRGSGRGASSAR